MLRWLQFVRRLSSRFAIPFNFPILLIWLYVVMIPLVVGVFYVPDTWIALSARNLTAAVFFIVISLIDWFDGFLTCRWNQTSAFGAFLDLVADKLMVAVALLVLLSLGRVFDAIALVIIDCEITIPALHEWMAQIGTSKSVAVNFLGKLKTIFQMTAIPLLLFEDCLFGMIDAQVWGTWLIYVVAVLTLWLMAYYMKLAQPQIREHAK